MPRLDSAVVGRGASGEYVVVRPRIQRRALARYKRSFRLLGPSPTRTPAEVRRTGCSTLWRWSGQLRLDPTETHERSTGCTESNAKGSSSVLLAARDLALPIALPNVKTRSVRVLVRSTRSPRSSSSLANRDSILDTRALTCRLGYVAVLSSDRSSKLFESPHQGKIITTRNPGPPSSSLSSASCSFATASTNESPNPAPG